MGEFNLGRPDAEAILRTNKEVVLWWADVQSENALTTGLLFRCRPEARA